MRLRRRPRQWECSPVDPVLAWGLEASTKKNLSGFAFCPEPRLQPLTACWPFPSSYPDALQMQTNPLYSQSSAPPSSPTAVNSAGIFRCCWLLELETLALPISSPLACPEDSSWLMLFQSPPCHCLSRQHGPCPQMFPLTVSNWLLWSVSFPSNQSHVSSSYSWMHWTIEDTGITCLTLFNQLFPRLLNCGSPLLFWRYTY